MTGIALLMLLVWAPWRTSAHDRLVEVIVRVCAMILCLGLTVAAAFDDL